MGHFSWLVVICFVELALPFVCQGQITHPLSSCSLVCGQIGVPTTSGCCGDLERRVTKLENALKAKRVEELIEKGYQKATNGYFYKLTNGAMNNAEAKEECVRDKAGLATVGARNVNLKKEIMDLLADPIDQPWIGLDKHYPKTVWTWEDGVIATRENTDWDPNNPSGDGTCGHLLNENEGRKVNDITCARNLYGLCEADPYDF